MKTIISNSENLVASFKEEQSSHAADNQEVLIAYLTKNGSTRVYGREYPGFAQYSVLMVARESKA